MILRSIETNDKNLLESIIDFSYTYPCIFVEILNLYKVRDVKANIAGENHFKNIFAIQMIQNYYMYQEEIFTWVHILRDYGKKIKESILEIYLEIYAKKRKTLNQNKILNLKDEYNNNKQEFIKDFILVENKKQYYNNRLTHAFDDLFGVVHSKTDGERLELIYNKTKHGGFCMYSTSDHGSERPYVPISIQEQKGADIFVEPCYLPTKLETFEDIHSRIGLHLYPFIEVMSVHLLQRYNVESEYKKNLNPTGPSTFKDYAQRSNLLNKPLFPDY